MAGDEFYLGCLDDLHGLHLLKSAGYGTDEDALANFAAVAAVTGEPAWRYPRRRAIEKLARCESLERQGRLDELEEEHLDASSLLLCAEALRRRYASALSPAPPRPPHPRGAGLSDAATASFLDASALDASALDASALEQVARIGAPR